MAISTVSPGYSALAVNADGQIFFAAAGQTVGGGVNLRVAEFNKYGTVDSSFGTSGTASTGTISGDGIGVVLEIELNGQIVIGAGGSGSSGHFILGRFNANGSKDTTFGSGGVEIGAAEGGGLAMVTAANGEAVLIGKRSSGNGIILQEFGTLADCQVLYPTFDADFNTTSLTNSSGGVLERYSTDAYGNVTVLNADGSVRGDGTLASSFYAWDYFDQGLLFSVNTGLYYNRFRQTLDPALGRFLQPDPTGGMYVNGLNLYQNRVSNPNNNLDPTGLNDHSRDSVSHRPGITNDTTDPIISAGDDGDGNWVYTVLEPGQSAGDGNDQDYVFYKGSWYKVRPAADTLIWDYLTLWGKKANQDPKNQTYYHFDGKQHGGVPCYGKQIYKVDPNKDWYPGKSTKKSKGQAGRNQAIDQSIVDQYRQEYQRWHGQGPINWGAINQYVNSLTNLTPTKQSLPPVPPPPPLEPWQLPGWQAGPGDGAAQGMY